jgi:hypothetical protein
MQTLTNPTASRKPAKAFYAHLYDQAGALAKVDGTIYFMASETGTITAIEPEHCTFLPVLGEIGLADTQAIMDHLHGGAARIACDRLQEVA